MLDDLEGRGPEVAAQVSEDRSQVLDLVATLQLSRWTLGR
jgi:hypothetical protein